MGRNVYVKPKNKDKWNGTKENKGSNFSQSATHNDKALQLEKLAQRYKKRRENEK